MASLTNPDQWQLDPLPLNCSSLAILLSLNGSALWNGTAIFNGSEILNCTGQSNITGTWSANSPFNMAPVEFIGNVPLITFIYLILSLAIIVLLARSTIKWIRTLTKPFDTGNLLPIYERKKLSVKAFKTRLETLFPPPERQIMSFSEKLEKEKDVSEEVRDVREMLRAKYLLDLEIEGADGERKRMLEDRAQEGLNEIRRKVATWVERKEQWSAEERRLVEEIQRRIGGVL